MSELSELTAPETPAPAAEKPPRRWWPLIAGVLIAGVIAVTGAVAGLGVTGALVAGGCTAGAGAAGLVLWRLPQLRKHFASPRRGMRRSQSSSRRTLGGGRGGSGGRKMRLPGLGGGRGKGAGRALGGKRGGGKSLLAGKGKALGRALTGGRRGGAGKSSSGKGGPLRRLLGRGGTGGRRPGLGLPGKRSGGLGKPGGGRPGLIRRAIRSLRPRGGQRRTGGDKPGRLRRTLPALALPFLAPFAVARGICSLIRKRRKGAPAPEVKPEAPAAPPSGPASPARKPGQPLVPNTADPAPTRRRAPLSNQLEHAADAISHGVGGFHPENVADLEQFLTDLPRVYEALADGLHHVADRFTDDLPVSQQVSEHLREMGSTVAGLADYAGEAQRIFRTAHAEDLERLENPRPGEEFMDHAQQ
jgi:hypothetical protein